MIVNICLEDVELDSVIKEYRLKVIRIAISKSRCDLNSIEDTKLILIVVTNPHSLTGLDVSAGDEVGCVGHS